MKPTRRSAKGNHLYYRPKDYFGRTLQSDLILSRVKGQQRRQMASALIEEGATELPHELLDESLGNAERAAVSAIHPLMMSGEYLPDLAPGEVEIARVILESTMGDVFSVRARPKGKRIAFRVVDEFEDNFGEGYRAITRKAPLSLGELLQYMETCREGGILMGCADANLEGGASVSDLDGFVRAESAFYPDLAAVVDDLMEAWVGANRSEDEDLGDEEDEEGTDEDAR